WWMCSGGGAAFCSAGHRSARSPLSAGSPCAPLATSSCPPADCALPMSCSHLLARNGGAESGDGNSERHLLHLLVMGADLPGRPRLEPAECHLPRGHVAGHLDRRQHVLDTT